MKKFLLLIITISVCSLSFAKSEKGAEKAMPIWIERPYSVYKASEYFAQSGSDKNKATAELKAVENLAAIFSRDIKSESLAESQMSRRQVSSRDEETEINSSLNSKVLSEVDQNDLIGIEIAETFFDEKTKNWYALALLNKEKTADLYSKLIEKNSSSIKKLMAAEKSLPPSIKKVAYIYRAMKLSQLNESYFPRFYVIHPEKCENARSGNIASTDLRIELDDVAAKIPVAIEVKNDFDTVAWNSCEELVKMFGLCINSKNPKYRLVADINPTYRDVQNPPMTYCEYLISAKVISDTNSILLPWESAGRGAGKNKELAIQKARMQISEKIKTDYADVFEEYFYGETK